MSTPLSKNVVAYDPESNPAKIDIDALRKRGWPSSVLECIQKLQIAGSPTQMLNSQRETTQRAEPDLPETKSDGAG